MSAKILISFVVPAHNEEAFLGETLQAMRAVIKEIDKPCEIIVVDDASTDRTAEVARGADVRVEHVSHRNIGATRNSGAKVARGDFIFFVDADTLVNTRTITAALQFMERGAVGGGALPWLKPGEAVPLYVRLGLLAGYIGGYIIGFPGGVCTFCTREAFLATGGFNERMFWSEDTAFSLALKREGRYRVPWVPVLTSGRRFRAKSRKGSLWQLLRVFYSPVKMLTDRSAVAGIWYNSDRSEESAPSGFALRIANFVRLVALVVALIGLVWVFIPGTHAPWPGWLGTVRTVATIPLAHIGLVFWPLAGLLLANLVRQKRPTDLPYSFLLLACYGWIGWNSATYLVWLYGRLWNWLIE